MRSLIDKIKNTGTKTAFYLALPLALYGCNKDESDVVKDNKKDNEIIVEEPDEEEPTTNDSTENYGDTYILDEEDLEKISVKEDRVYSEEPLTYLEKGDIISTGISEKTPYGFLREVTGVFADFTEIQTKQTSLEEAIEEGSIEEQFSFTEQDIESTNMGRISKNNSGRGFALDYEGVIYDRDNNLSTRHDQVKVKGDLFFDLDTYAKLKIRNRKIREANIEVNFTGEISVELNSNLKDISFDEEIKAGELGINPFVMSIGVVPVVVHPEIEFYVSAQGEVGSQLNSKIGDSFSASSYISYLDGEWTSGKDFSNQFDFNVSTGANTNVKASSGPKLNLKLYDLAGPSIRTDAYLELDVNTNDNPWWELYGGLESKLGCDVSVLGKSLVNYEKTISDNRIRIADAGGPFANTKPDAYFVWDPRSGTTETIFTFNSSGSYDEEDGLDLKYRWDWTTDGIWDTEFSYEKSKTHQFSNEGNHRTTLQVKDSHGAKDEVSTLVQVESPSGGGGGLDSLVIQPGPEGKDATVTYNLWPDGDETFNGKPHEEELYAWYENPSWERDERILIKFPLSNLPEGSDVASARIDFYGYALYNRGSSTPISMRKLNSSWEEENVDYSNRPSSDLFQTEEFNYRGKKWTSWDVTSLVKDWVESKENYGVELFSRARDASYVVNSGDSQETDKRPKLIIYYQKD